MATLADRICVDAITLHMGHPSPADAGPLTRPGPSVAVRHLPTLWGVTLAEGAFTKEYEIFAAAYCKGLRLLL